MKYISLTLLVSISATPPLGGLMYITLTTGEQLKTRETIEFDFINGILKYKEL